MVKFQVLQHNRRFLSTIFRTNVEDTNDPRMKSAAKFSTWIPLQLMLFIICSASSVVSCAVRMFDSSYDFTNRLDAFFLLIALSQMIAVFINMGVNMQKIVALFQTLQAVVDNEGVHFSF